MDSFLIKLFFFFMTVSLFESQDCQEPDFFALATINYGHLKSSQPWIRKQEEMKMLNAMEHIGFMVLTNHGISKQIMDDMWNITTQFFDSSALNKNEVPMTEEYMYGYSSNEVLSVSEDIEYFNKTANNNNNSSNTAQMGVDQKEMFSVWIGAPNTNRAKDVLWPSEPTQMNHIWTLYYRECEKVAAQLLTSFASILELENPDFFEPFINDHMAALRTLNYPKQSDRDAIPVNSMRCSAHSDYGTFTLLRQDGIGGLQLDRGNGEWVDVVSDQYDFVINLGNAMKIWTNDRFQSTRHRVVNPRNEQESERRQSIAFFHGLNGNAVIETFESCLYENGTSKYEPINFLELLTKLHLASQMSY